MKIKEYISNLLQSNIYLYNADGLLINKHEVLLEYYKIKNYLYDNFNEGTIVGLYLKKDYKYLLTLLACMDLGLTYSPFRKEWPHERIEQIEKISGCFTITDDIWVDIQDYSSEISINSFHIDAIKPLYVMFTSGTTGEPKGVIIKRESYENFLFWLDNYFDQITSKDKMLFSTDFTFDISLVDIGLFLVKQLSLYISSFKNNMLQLLYELDKYKITTHSTVPYNYTMLTNSNIIDQADLSNLKFVILAGSRFPYTLYMYFKENFPHINMYNAYGPTEGTIYVTAHKINYTNDEKNKNISIGQPVTNCKIKIIDDELYVAGVQIMQGYINESKKTNDALIEINGILYYKTGDLAFIDDNQNYFVVGRKDDTVKIAGFRVNLLDIDAYIQSINYIKDSVTIMIENHLTDDAFLVTHIILNEKKDIKEIRKSLNNILLSYQIAKKIIILNEFPLNNSGKVDKNTLKNTFKRLC